MNKNILITILTSFFFVLSFIVTAQPGDPGEDPNGNGQAVGGGGAPIGSGTLILMALGAAYAGKKGYKLYKENQEELED